MATRCCSLKNVVRTQAAVGLFFMSIAKLRSPDATAQESTDTRTGLGTCNVRADAATLTSRPATRDGMISFKQLFQDEQVEVADNLPNPGVESCCMVFLPVFELLSQFSWPSHLLRASCRCVVQSASGLVPVWGQDRRVLPWDVEGC